MAGMGAAANEPRDKITEKSSSVELCITCTSVMYHVGVEVTRHPWKRGRESELLCLGKKGEANEGNRNWNDAGSSAPQCEIYVVLQVSPCFRISNFCSSPALHRERKDQICIVHHVPSQIDRIGTRVQESCNVATCSSS